MAYHRDGTLPLADCIVRLNGTIVSAELLFRSSAKVDS
jgi:hypothetical protein